MREILEGKALSQFAFHIDGNVWLHLKEISRSRNETLAHGNHVALDLTCHISSRKTSVLMRSFCHPNLRRLNGLQSIEIARSASSKNTIVFYDAAPANSTFSPSTSLPKC